MMKVLKKIGKAYLVFLIVYWSVAGIMSLFWSGYNWGAECFDGESLRRELKKRFWK